MVERVRSELQSVRGGAHPGRGRTGILLLPALPHRPTGPLVSVPARRNHRLLRQRPARSPVAPAPPPRTGHRSRGVLPPAAPSGKPPSRPPSMSGQGRVRHRRIPVQHSGGGDRAGHHLPGLDRRVRARRGGDHDRHHVAAVLDPHHRRGVRARVRRRQRRRSAYDTVYVTANSTGTVVDTQHRRSTDDHPVCNKPTGTAAERRDAGGAVRATSPTTTRWIRPRRVAAAVRLRRRAWTACTSKAGPSPQAQRAVHLHVHPGHQLGRHAVHHAMRGVVEAGSGGPSPTTPPPRPPAPAPPSRAAPGSILLCGAMTDPGAARTWTPPTGMTEQADVQSAPPPPTRWRRCSTPSEPTGTKDFTA
jgi:hypothetical protein